MSDLGPEDWLSALGVHPSEPPPGWKTAEQIAAMIGKSKSRASHLLSDGVRSGAIERRTFIIESNGRRMPMPHYQIKGNSLAG